jgi:group I intron endonuclease
MTKKISGVYLIKNKLTNKCYVGVSVNIHARWRQHKYWAKNDGVVSKITNAIKKNGIENFDFSVVEECHKDVFEEKERHWIKEYDSVLNGYNLTYGGNVRKTVSEETKLKMSNSRLGVPKSESHKQKIAKANSTQESKEKNSKRNLGKKLSDETKKKMSLSKKGHEVSEETRQKIRNAWIAYKSRMALQSEQRPKLGRPAKVKHEPTETQSDSGLGD